MDNLTDETLPPVDPAVEQSAEPTPEATPATAPETPAAPAAPAAPTRSRYERREQASADALRGLIRDFLLEKYPAIMEAGEPLMLSIDLLLEPGEPGALRFEPDLRRQVSEQVQVILAPRDAYEEGAVYDFQQNSPRVPGCRPPEPDAVFAGYDNLGRAKWHSFTQCLLDARAPQQNDPRVWKGDVEEARPDDLFFDSPRDSWVLLGSRGKAHAFANDGRYITTFPVSASMLEQRIVSGRWVAEHPERENQLQRMRA